MNLLKLSSTTKQQKIDDESIGDYKIENYIGLIKYHVNKFKRNQDEFEDLVQEGCIGFMLAKESYLSRLGEMARHVDKEDLFSAIVTSFVKGRIKTWIKKKIRKGIVYSPNKKESSLCVYNIDKVLEFGDADGLLNFISSDYSITKDELFLNLERLDIEEKNFIILYYFEYKNTAQIRNQLKIKRHALNTLHRISLKKLKSWLCKQTIVNLDEFKKEKNYF